MAETVCVICGQTGGRFRFIGEGKWAHVRSCVQENIIFQPGKKRWEFETTNIHPDPNTGPIKVQSLRHLRQLEQQYGVHSIAANMDQSNWEK